MFNVYLENRYRCCAVVIRNFTASDLNQYIQLHDNRVTRVQFCKQASSVTKFSKELLISKSEFILNPSLFPY